MIKGFKTINLLLILVAIVMGGWLVKTWSAPVELPTLKDTVVEGSPEVTKEDAIPISSYYNVIIEKDLFRSSRKRYVAKIVPPPLPPPPLPPPPPPPPPPKRPIPKFTLYGTVILEDKDDVAIISTNMQNRKPAFYNVGDEIEEGFVLKEIHKNKVFLKREEDEETTEVSFKSPSMAPTMPGLSPHGRRPRPPIRRRGDRRIEQKPPTISTPQSIPPPFSGVMSPPIQKPPEVPSRPQNETKSSSRGTSSTTTSSSSTTKSSSTSTTTSQTSSQPSSSQENDTTGESKTSPSSEESGETPQGGEDIPSPPSEDNDELPPSIPSG